jgi:endonuclease YncB( thermonuclease family)
MSINLAILKNSDVEEFSLAGQTFVAKVVDVHDGDTCRIVILLNDKPTKFICRLKGIDTPEIRPLKSKPNREAEIEEAKVSRNRLIELVTGGVVPHGSTAKQIMEHLNKSTKLVTAVCHEFDKYGRLLITLNNKEGGDSFNDLLISEGLAKAYDGGTKEPF